MVSVDRGVAARAAAARPRGLGEPGTGLAVEAVLALVDPGFLVEVGWDAQRQVICPPADHPLLGRPVCRVVGCDNSAHNPRRICQGCAQRLADYGVSVAELGDGAVEMAPPRQRRRPRGCAVPGCAREWVSQSLCNTHRRQQRRVLRVPMDVFLTHPQVRGLPACPPCAVPACTRQRKGPEATYCAAHQQQWWKARRADPGVEETAWRTDASAPTRPGEISLRGLHPMVVAQLLLGMQERARTGRKHFDDHMRYTVNAIRRQHVTSLTEVDLDRLTSRMLRSLIRSMIDHLRRFFVDAETEKHKDIWDLAAFGIPGRAWFTEISQHWLREATKAWAVDDLPRRRGNGIAAGLRGRIKAMAQLSASLRLRTDHGQNPAMLDRSDIDNFVNRLAYLQSVDQISVYMRRKVLLEARTVLDRIRALGLTRPGRAAAGLGPDFVITLVDIPHLPQREPDRDLPPEIMTQLCEHLPELEQVSNRQTRVAVELLMDTGRRPTEICRLPLDCLTRDNDSRPVLVYDNTKSNRVARRLPIADATAQLIVQQQQRIRAQYPTTPLGELKLLPARQHNRAGRDAIGAGHVSLRHGVWVAGLPVLHTSDGAEFNKSRIMLYAYRHTYAQRHADAGVPVDVLRELMDHTVMDTSKQYYRVGEQRRREAVDRLVALQFDRHGNRIWRDAKTLLDSEHARRAVGEVVVPFGVCAEPSNVQAGGGACPYRFRCVGCDHFRTDVSYLPDLHTYLDDLLRNRERLRAAVDVDDWARAEATPSDEEITRIRRLINRITGDLDALDEAERAQIEQAVAVVRRHRATMLGMPRQRQPLPDIRPERSA